MKKIILLIAFFMISACGFQPLYGQKSTAASVLNDIWIDPIQDRDGVALRNELIDRFYIDGYPKNPRYVLAITLQDSVRDLDIREDDTTTRAQLIQRAGYTLKNRTTGQIIFKENLRSVNSYNILASQFTTTVTAAEARERGVRDLADKIQNRLAIYLSQSY